MKLHILFFLILDTQNKTKLCKFKPEFLYDIKKKLDFIGNDGRR